MGTEWKGITVSAYALSGNWYTLAYTRTCTRTHTRRRARARLCVAVHRRMCDIGIKITNYN